MFPIMKFLLVLSVAFASALADASLEEFTTGTKLFTGDVYKQVLTKDYKNFLVSPFSADTIVALTQSGAKGATGEEIRTALHLPSTTEEVEADFKSVLPTMKSDHIAIKSANKIYVDKGLAVKEEFKAVAKDVYQAHFQNIAFEETSAAVEEINSWVAEQTNDKIQELLTTDDLDATTTLVLVNALYFQGNWSEQFDSDATKTETFYMPDDSTLDVVTMFRESAQYNYAEDEELDAQILEIPFAGNEASVTFVLPNKVYGITLLEKEVEKVFKEPSFTKEWVQVKMPRFRIETTVDFKKVLEKLGVVSAFEPSLADFSGIAGEPGELFIALAKQKTYIDVNEGGVEASAATAVGDDRTGGEEPTKYFIADHPFIFYLKVKGVVLFEGRVMTPEY